MNPLIAMISSEKTNDPIGPGDTVRDVLTRYPHAATVFDRHGLGGCGGPQGPIEPIGFFAVVHHVDPDVLLKDLNTFIASAQPRQAPAPGLAVKPAPLYPPFLKSSLLLAVAAGFSLGLWALLSQSEGIPTGALSWAVLVQMHGHVQLWGFAGLFIMGVAYHVVPRFHALEMKDAERRMARASFWLVVAGIALRFSQFALPGDWPYLMLMASALAIATGAGSFAFVMTSLLLRDRQWAGYERFIAAGAAWAVIAAMFQLVTTGLLWNAQGRVVPAYLNEPFLTLFLWGFVVMIVLGISARVLPAFLGLRPSKARVLDAAFYALNGGAALTALSQALLRGDAGQIAGWLWLAGSAALMAGVLAFTAGLRILEPRAGSVHGPQAQAAPHGFHAFIRIAYLWLLIASALGVFLALLVNTGSQQAAMTDMSAARHALALGFITLMIVSVAARIVPVFRGAPLFNARMQLAALWLILASAILRVSIELWMGYGSRLDPLLTLSGLLGFLGITLFALNIWLTLEQSARTASIDISPMLDALRRPESAAPVTDYKAVTAGMLVANVLERYPRTLDIFLSNGFEPLANPAMREKLAASVTVAQAARIRGVNLASLMEALNKAIEDVDDEEDITDLER